MKKFESQELQQKYQNDQNFREKVDAAEEQYRQIVNKAKKANPQALSRKVPEQILERFKKQGNQAIYFFYGLMQPAPARYYKQFCLAFVKYFDPEYLIDLYSPKQKFTFVYFNNETPNSAYYLEFKRVMALLPYQITQNLKEFILVKPYFYHKAYDYVGLGAINRIFANRHRSFENCQDLLEHLKVPVKDFVSFVPQELSQQFPRTYKKRPSLVSYRMNVEGQNMTEEEKQKQKVDFEQTIKAVITKEVYKLQNYEIGDLGIPIIIQLLIHYFRSKPEGLDQEGIFRKSVSVDEENETLEELSKRNFQYLEHIKNPFLIASLIKKFFSNLKLPIIDFKTYEQLIHDQGVKNKKQHIKKLIQALPKLNFMTLAYLIHFIRKDVIPHESKSKMSANNLAICFSPSLMRSQKPSMADIVNASKSVAITNILIADFEYIFGTEEQLSKMYQSNIRKKNKDINQTIIKQLQIQTSPRPEHNSIDYYSVQVTEPQQNNKKGQKESVNIQYQSKGEEGKKYKKKENNTNALNIDEDKKSQPSREVNLSSQKSKQSREGQLLDSKSKQGSKHKAEDVKSNHSMKNDSKYFEAFIQQPLASTKSQGNLQPERVEPTSAEMNPKIAKAIIRFSYNKKQQQ